MSLARAVKLVEPHVADAVVEQLGADLLEVDHRAGDRDVHLLVIAADRQRHVGSGLAAHDVHERAHRLAGRSARRRSRGSGHRPRDPASSAGEPSSGETTTIAQLSVTTVHDSRSSGSDRFSMPTSAPMPLNSPDRLVERLAVLARGQVAGIRVLEAVLDHAAHRAVHELLVGELVDVARPDLGVRLAERREGLGRLRARDRLERRRRARGRRVGRDGRRSEGMHRPGRTGRRRSRRWPGRQ